MQSILDFVWSTSNAKLEHGGLVSKEADLSL